MPTTVLASSLRCTCSAMSQGPGRRASVAARVAVPHFHAPEPALPSRMNHAHALDRPVQRVLPLMSDLMEAQAVTRRFEQLAGRVAMLAAAAALAAELLLPSSDGVAAHGVFGWAATSALAPQFAALASALLCCSVGAAAAGAAAPSGRHRLLEPLLASLTSVRRSFSGVTQRNVDRSVDYLLDTVFTAPFLREHFPADEDKDI